MPALTQHVATDRRHAIVSHRDVEVVSADDNHIGIVVFDVVWDDAYTELIDETVWKACRYPNSETGEARNAFENRH
jgi:hypothetical protein